MEIIQREGPDCDAIADVTFVELRPIGLDAFKTALVSGRTRTVHQTVAYFTRPELKTPAFTAGPMHGIVGGAMRKVLGLVGMPTVSLPEYPDFNKQFIAMSLQPAATQKLFTQPVVDTISRHSEFVVTTGKGRIAVYRRGKTVPPSDRQAFYTAAREIADRIIESTTALDAEAMTGGQRALKKVQTMGGWMGHGLAAWAVSTQEVNDLLAEAPPRVAPRGIRKWAYGSTRFLMIWAAVVLFLATTFAVAVLIIGVEDKPANRGFPHWLPYVFMGMGGVVLSFAALCRWRQRRILRDGICEQAKVVKVRDSDFYSGNERQHYVTFETDSGRVVVRLGSGPASLARTLQEGGETVRLLVDPKNRSRALWIEGWAMDAYE